MVPCDERCRSPKFFRCTAKFATPSRGFTIWPRPSTRTLRGCKFIASRRLSLALWIERRNSPKRSRCWREASASARINARRAPNGSVKGPVIKSPETESTRSQPQDLSDAADVTRSQGRLGRQRSAQSPAGVAINQQAILACGKEVKLLPGMAVTVEISLRAPPRHRLRVRAAARTTGHVAGTRGGGLSVTSRTESRL